MTDRNGEQSPVQFLKGVIIHETLRIRQHGHHDVNIVIPLMPGQERQLRATVETVQNTLNPLVFGANVGLENFFLRIDDESAYVDILIVLLHCCSNISRSSSIKGVKNDLRKYLN